MLLSHGAEVDACNLEGVTSLVVAAEQGHAHVVKALLEHGARPTRAAGNGATPLFVAAKNGHSEVP